MDHCEIPPIRTKFIDELGQGAFGKVHKAKLKDGMEYFESHQDWVKTERKQKIVAVKELHGEFENLSDTYLCQLVEGKVERVGRPYNCAKDSLKLLVNMPFNKIIVVKIRLSYCGTCPPLK